MSGKSVGSRVLLAGVLSLAACGEQNPAAPADTSADTSLELQAALSVAGDDAASSGDVERAEALRAGVSALRWGIKPSQIEVKIHNETYTYLAIVVGVVRRPENGERVLVRSLVAWTGRPPTAILHVISASDQALFGHPGDDGPGGARGQWKDLVAHELWAATAGSADIELGALGHACPVQPASAELQCVLASYDVRVNGNFQQVGSGGPDGPHIEIHTEADGVHGIVIRPAQ